MALNGLRPNGSVVPGAPGIVLNAEGQSAYVFEKNNKPAVAYNPGDGHHIGTGVAFDDYQKAITASESNKFSFFRFTSEYRTVDKLLAKALGMETSQISGFFGKTLWGKGKVRSFLCDLVYKYHLPREAAREVFNILVANKGNYKKLVNGFDSDPRNEASRAVVDQLARQLARCGVDLSSMAGFGSRSDSHGVQLLGIACRQAGVVMRGIQDAFVMPFISHEPLLPPAPGGAGEGAVLDGMQARLRDLLQQGLAMGQELDRQDAARRTAAAAMPPPAPRPPTTQRQPPPPMDPSLTLSTRPPPRQPGGRPTRQAQLDRIGNAASALAGSAAGFAANARAMAINTILGDYADRLRALNERIGGGDLADVVAKAVEDKRLHQHKVKDFTEALEGAIGAMHGKTAQQIVDGMLDNPGPKWNEGTVGGFFRSLFE